VIRRAVAAALALLALAATMPAAAETVVEGRATWARRATLGFPVSGVIAELPVRAGQRVARGALLARLDPRPFDARVREREARVAALEPAFAEARREWERAQALYERMVLSDRDRELVRIAYVRAEAELRAARAALARARIEREYAELRAPFEALVLRVHAVPGQALASRLRVSPVVELAELGALAVEVALEGDARPPGAGAAATVRAAGRRYAGRVERVEPVDRGWRVRVGFRVPPADGIGEGTPVEVILP